MNFFKNILGKKELPIRNYKDFWIWFQQNEEDFFNVVKSHGNFKKDFFDKLSPKLDELKEGFFFVTGMYDDHTAELILTPDGVVANIVFVEELVKAAPAIPNWKFTALKPSMDIKNVTINMAGYVFGSETLSFYANEHKNYPDEIDIVIVYSNYKEDDKSMITNGTFIFLDNFLGELNAVTTIDNLVVIGKDEAQKELVPIAKLKEFLIWREKEFLEKYEGKRHDTEKDTYASAEVELKNDRRLIAILNSTLLEWDSKASHPWILNVKISYKGDQNNGMPDKQTLEKMNEFGDKIENGLKDMDGYLNIGRQTGDNSRETYFACKEFRKPSKFLHELITNHSNGLEITFEIYKDKYWQSFERFRSN